MDVSEFPSSAAEFRGRFADDNRCREYLARLKWPEGFRCAHCAGDRAYFLPSKRVVYEYAGCGRQVSVIAGTIFEQSKKPLVLWFKEGWDQLSRGKPIVASMNVYEGISFEDLVRIWNDFVFWRKYIMRKLPENRSFQLK